MNETRHAKNVMKLSNVFVAVVVAVVVVFLVVAMAFDSYFDYYFVPLEKEFVDVVVFGVPVLLVLVLLLVPLRIEQY